MPFAPVTANTTLAPSSIVYTGPVVFFNPRNSGGVVNVYLQQNGIYELGLEQMNYKTINETNVYLSSLPQVTATAVKLFSRTDFFTNIYYSLPSSLNIAALRYLVLQGDADTSPAATALLK